MEPKYDFGEVFSCLDVNCLANLQIARPPESANQLRRESSDSHLGDSYVICTPVKILDTVFMAPKIFWMFWHLKGLYSPEFQCRVSVYKLNFSMFTSPASVPEPSANMKMNLNGREHQRCFHCLKADGTCTLHAFTIPLVHRLMPKHVE